MKIDDLINVSLNEAGINFLVSLPEPNKSPLLKANIKELLESCKTFHRLWRELLIDGISLPHVELKDLPKDMVVPKTSEEIGIVQQVSRGKRNSKKQDEQLKSRQRHLQSG